MPESLTHSPIVDIDCEFEREEPITITFKSGQITSTLNGGYTVYLEGYDVLSSLFKKNVIDVYLNKARKEPIYATVRVRQYTDKRESEPIKIIIDKMMAYNVGGIPVVGLLGVDPPTWWLRRNSAIGSVYIGNIKETITQIVQDAAPGISVDMDDTTDDKKNTWYTMRLSPKEMIKGLLDWSTPLDKEAPSKHTMWLVYSKDKTLYIKDYVKLRDSGKDPRIYNWNDQSQVRHLLDYWYVSNSQVPEGIASSNISLSTGKFLDISQHNFTVVEDDNTAGKINTNSSEEWAITKGASKIFEYIDPIPESTTITSKKYEDYIDGRARKYYINSLYGLHKLTIRTIGDIDFMPTDKSPFGIMKVNIMWNTTDGEPYFLGGPWVVHGFKHDVKLEGFTTDVYLTRLEHNATGQNI